MSDRSKVLTLLTLLRLRGNLPRVEMSHNQHSAHKFELFCTCAGLFSHLSRRICSAISI